MEFPLPKGFWFHVHDAPRDKREINLLCAVFREVGLPEYVGGPSPLSPLEEALHEIRFEGPYNQGGIRLEVARCTLAYGAFMTPWGIFEDNTEEGRERYQPETVGLEYTGWCMMDNYHDSMTNRFFSPIYWGANDDQEIVTWEM